MGQSQAESPGRELSRENTTLARKRIGDRVNIEVDIIGKYVKRFLGKGEGIDAQFLVEHGFL